MTVRVFNYTLTPRSRISAGSAAEVANNRAIHHVIPGTVVRGALGSAWWRSVPEGGYRGVDPQPVFDRAFTAAMRIGPAVPCRGDTTARLATLTMVRCKYPDPECGCIDEWLDTAALSEPPRVCRCEGPLEHGRGWQLDTSNGPSWMVGTTRTELEGGIAKSGRLFTRNALRRDLVLRGQLRVVTGGFEPDTLSQVLEWLTTSRAISIGGQRSILGRCSWTCQETAAPVKADPLGYAVRLTSPAILLDAWGASTMDLKGAVDAVIAGTGGTGRVTRSVTRPVTVSGWHGMAGLPKPEEWAVSDGSVAVVEAADEPTLAALADGVGIRRAEGYGTVHLVGLSTLPTDDHIRTWALGQTPKGPARPGQPAVDDQQESQEEIDPVRAVLRLVPLDRHEKTITGMLAYARIVNGRRRAGTGVAMIRPYVQGLVSLPWMRDLSGPAQDAVVSLWLSDDLDAQIPTLERLKGGDR